jgi:hypothetical protein
VPFLRVVAGTPQRSIASAVAVSVLLRARFLFEGLLADEGGALSAARSWSSGAPLYRDVWVDRPQGVFLLVRGWDAVPFTDTSSIRMLAVVFGAAAIVATAAIVWLFAGARAAVFTAWFAALLSASPMLEGFAANGELLAAGWALPGLAIVAAVATRRLATPWMLLAGVLAGAALTIKQSSFDVILVVAAWEAVMFVTRRRAFGRALGELALFGLGTAVLPVLCIWHGTTLGWDSYYYVVAGFRVDARSAVSSPEFDRLLTSLAFTAPVMLPALFVALRGERRRPGWLPRTDGGWFVALWALASSAAFVTGGSFWRHYFVILAFPLAALAGVAAARLGQRWLHAVGPTALIGVLCAVPLVANPRLILGDIVETNTALAEWVRQQPGDEPPSFYVYCADAALYSEVGVEPPYRYLWEDHVRLARDAQEQLLAYLTGSDAPDVVFRVQPFEQCDETGAITAAIQQHYEPTVTIGEAEVWKRRADAPDTD